MDRWCGGESLRRDDRTGQVVDQDSQSACIYSSARFANNIFVDGSELLTSTTICLLTHDDGTYVDGKRTLLTHRASAKLGYDDL
ncbi:hypothetical protein KCP73_06025 [Salmonella enterica subsp. enterica]|nr:hypothetical protein KCP73_06025 [Salmonella enterica subsp. enterica]